MSHHTKKRTLIFLLGLLVIVSLACVVTNNGNDNTAEDPTPESPPTDTPAPPPPTETPTPEPGFEQAVGEWESTDIDGSYQTLEIKQNADGTYKIEYYDDGASICGVADDGTVLYPASVEANGAADHLTLDVPSFKIICHGDTDWIATTVAVSFTYDPAADTLADSWGSFWTRMP